MRARDLSRAAGTFVCVQSHAAIDAAFVAEPVVHQNLEPVVQGEQLPELKLEDFTVFFWQNLFQPYVKIYIV